MENIAVQELYKKRNQLISERLDAINKFDNMIHDVDFAIERLTGNNPGSPKGAKEYYDDENPNYITGTEDGI